MEYYYVKNWQRFQHYKDRNPPWIKLHVELMTNNSWVMSGDHEKALLVGFMILAAKTDNNIPADENYLKKVLHLEKPPNIKFLIDTGFVGKSSGKVESASPWPSRHVPALLKEQVLARDKHQCCACKNKKNLEIDHIIPVSKGGESKIDNLQTLCRSCNRKKRNRVALATQEDAQRSLETETYSKEEETEKEDKYLEKKKISKKEKESFSLPSDIPVEAWNDYIDMRIKVRKPMTDKAKQMAITQLYAFREQGYDMAGVLQQSVFNSWQGLFAIKGVVPHPPSEIKKSLTITDIGEDNDDNRGLMKIFSMMQKKHGDGIMRSWINPIRIKNKNCAMLTFQTPSRFIAEWMKSHYAEDFLAFASKVWPEITHVDFIGKEES